MVKFFIEIVSNFFRIMVGVSKIDRTFIMNNIIIRSFTNYQDIGILLEIISQITKCLVVFIRNGPGLNDQLLGAIRPKIKEVKYKQDEYYYLFT